MGKAKKGGKPTKKDESPRRFGWQDRQEAASKADFLKRLAQLGWNALEPAKDLGEDYLVQIYDDGVSSGLSFYVQLKSIKDAEKHKGKRAPNELRYSLDVKDIEHWEVQSPPVVLVVWDLDKQVGYWEAIPRIVEGLEKEKKKWRENASVTVKVPLANTTDEEGMGRLRWLIGKYVEPLIPKIGNVKTVFSFPATDEGTAALKALQQSLDDGTSTTIDGKFIASVQYPAWHRRLYGDVSPPQSLEVQLHIPNDFTFRMRLEIQADHDSVSIPYVEFRTIRSGQNSIVLTNERQGLPLEITFKFDFEQNSGSVDIRRTRSGRTPNEEREAIAILLWSRRAGSLMRLVDLEKKVPDFHAEISSEGTKAELESLLRYYEILEKLCFIQARVARLGTITLDPNREINNDDAALINDLFTIIRDGRREKIVSLGFTVKQGTKFNNDEMNLNVPGPVKLRVEAKPIQLLGVSIPIGKVRMICKDEARFVREYRRAVLKARDTGEPARVSLTSLPIVEEYLDWLPYGQEGERLQLLASSQSGYFTVNQAISAGYPSLDILVVHERVERCADGVYRFLLHPPSEREDLVVTWLQTEQQGVFSHDTALALHELSDILPVRQHITVPPGWTPVEGMALSANTVLHYGLVETNEKSWMGPVPYTKPLRTLVDCIDDNLPPDILDQALSDAFRRGMLSPAELQALQARKAKSA